jgi:hypothetical protein
MRIQGYFLHFTLLLVYSKNNTRFRSYPTFIGSRDNGVPDWIILGIKPILCIERTIWHFQGYIVSTEVFDGFAFDSPELLSFWGPAFTLVAVSIHG